MVVIQLAEKGLTMRGYALMLSLSVFVLSACASAPAGPAARMAGGSPVGSVERFLQAANSGDLGAMAQIFGTADGPIADRTGNTFTCAFKRIGSWFRLGSRCVTWADIEIRMSVIATVLTHDVYHVRSEANVPGRSRPTSRIGVDLDVGNTRYSDVPFVVVQTTDGGWLVEEVGLERITAQIDRPRRLSLGRMGYHRVETLSSIATAE